MAEGGARAPLAPIRHRQQQAALGNAACAPPPRQAVVPYVPLGTFPPPQQLSSSHPTLLPPPTFFLPPTPRVLLLKRSPGHDFGFTLRHFIIYPPESIADLFFDRRHAAVGALRECMDTIFVKSVHEGGPAYYAGLEPGDRLLAVDEHYVTGWPYARVVQLIKQAQTTLRLQVVPKEADILQRYFGEAAYNPETNQRPLNRRERRTSAGEMPLGLGVGTGVPSSAQQLPIHYRPNTNTKITNDYNIPSDLQMRLKGNQIKNQKSIQPYNPSLSSSGKSDSSERVFNNTIENLNKGAIPRITGAQPQVPLQRTNNQKASRRASEGARLLLDSDYYASPPSSPLNSSRDSPSTYTSGESLQSSHRNQMHLIKSTPTHIPHMNQALLNNKLVQYGSNTDNLQVQYANKFDFDDRRESNASLTSSAAESKDSFNYYDSTNDPDNVVYIDRIKKSLEQKEAFLRRPSQPTGWATPEQNVIQQREFYARPQKLHKTHWPPGMPSDFSPSKNKENIQDNGARTFHPAECEKNDLSAYQCSDTSGASKIDKPTASSSKQKLDKGAFHTTLSKIQENTPTFNDSGGNLANGSQVSSNSLETMLQEKRYQIPSELQIVSNRTKQFESLPSEDRTALYRSELARLNMKKPEPTVALRRKEFESRSGKRDARSLEAQQSTEENETLHILSGNRMLITGSKHLHCPPPEGYSPEPEKVHVRLRSNSTGSEGLPARRSHAADGSYMKRRLALSKEEEEALNNVTKESDWTKKDSERVSLPDIKCDINNKQVPNGYNDKSNNNNNNNNNDINIFVNKNMIEIDPTKYNGEYKQENSHKRENRIMGNGEKRPERPTQLSLAPGDNFVFPGGIGIHTLGSSPTTPSSQPSQPQSPSGVSLEDPVVTRRQKNAAQLGEEERAMRRVSYLKATWGDHLQFDSDHDLSDSEHQTLRSDKKEREEGNHDGDRAHEELEGGEIVMQGSVQVKMVLTKGKRASDRSWKQVWAVLQGSKLILYRNQHQSPTAGGSSESLNLRFSMADLAGDYTKRKHVVRVTSISGAELLLQAGSADEASQWLNALHAQAHKNEIVESQKPLDSPAEASGLSPPPRTKKHGNARTVSPTDNSPTPLTSSPKSKTWKGRVARQLRRIQTASSGTSPISTPNSSNSSPKMIGAVGIPLEKCESMPEHPQVPYLVGVCTRAVEERGLHVVGVYRVPGNTASVTALLDSLEKSPTPDLQDPRWNDVNVVSSLLKAFFRRLPNPLLTKHLYSMFITADKLPDRTQRVQTIKKLVKDLPDHHYETLKFLIDHLRKVAAENSVNKMEARNLAIVFGPTLVRSADDNMFTMVNDMSSQCRIIESLIIDMEWYFDEEDRSSPINDIHYEEESLPSTTPNQALLLQNVKKIEGKMDVSTKDIVSSIISAANRKIQRKPRSKANTTRDTSNSSNSKTREHCEKVTVSPDELNQVEKAPEVVSTSVSPPPENDNFPIKTYAGLEQNTQERIKRFEMETRAMLRREKKPNDWQHSPRLDSSSPITIIDNNTEGQYSLESAMRSNICSDSGITGKRKKTSTTSSGGNFNDGVVDMVSSLTSTFDQKLRSLHNSSPLDDASIPYVDECHDENQDFGDPSLHRSCDLNYLKEDSLSKNSDDKNKSESSSIKSANSGSQEIINLLSNNKKPVYNSHSEKNGGVKIQKTAIVEVPVKETIVENHCKTEMNGKSKTKSVEGDSDCEKDVDINSEQSSPDNVLPDNNRSAEKFNFSEKSFHESKPKCDNNKSAVDHKVSEPTIKNTLQDMFFKKGTYNQDKTDVVNTTLHIKNKLKRSESLNRETEKQMVKNNKLIISDNCNKSNDGGNESSADVEKPASPKLTRSVSLNRSSDVKLKWSDNLTKSEKTETNSRRRDIGYGGLNRASAKLKRKNGMPERSIKRRHTVGGTKDFDKDEWVALSCSRTSSPDLPTTIIDLPINAHISPIPLESHV